MDKVNKQTRVLFLAGAFLAGFASLLYQNYCIYMLFMFLPRSSELVALSIGGFLAGLGFSALLFGQWVRSDFKRARTAIILMQLVLLPYAFFVCADIQFLPYVLKLISDIFPADASRVLAVNIFVFLFLFIPAFLQGGVFPILNGLYVRALDQVTSDTAKVYFWDLAGSVAGCLMTGFVLIPYLGIRPTVLLAMAAGLLLVVLISSFSRKVVLASILAVCALAFYEMKSSLPLLQEHIEKTRFGKILFQKESPYGTVTVGEMGTIMTLYINMRDMCSSGAFQPSEVDLGQATADNIAPGSSVLNIGLGCGKTATTLSHHKNVDHLLVAEINPVVLEAYDHSFAGLHPLRDNGKALIKIEDGARILREGHKKFDAIVIDIEEVDIIYSSPLYTREYIEFAKAALNPGGVFSIWTFDVGNDFLKVMYNTLRAVFPHVEIAVSIGAVTMYASDKVIKLGGDQGTERVNTIKATQNDLIHTLQQPALERYYSPQRVFVVPAGYKERYMKD